MTVRRPIVIGDDGKKEELRPEDSLPGDGSLPTIICLISLQNCCQGLMIPIAGLITVCLRDGTTVQASPKVHTR